MRAAKVLAVLAIAALGIGSFSAVAQAAKKKKTAVVFFKQGPDFTKPGLVSAEGSLNTVSACEPNRSMRLQVLDSNGVVLTTLDGTTSDSSGNWILVGNRPTTLPAGTNYVRVKAKKRTVGPFGHAREPMPGGFICQAGFSANVAIPAA
jgi:hypothetical protein